MAIKVYNRKGNISLKEKAMVRGIEKAIAQLEAEGESLDFKTANNLSELEQLYNQYAVTDVEFTDTTDTQKEESGASVDKFKKSTEIEKESTEKVIDPFNRDEPIVRDYVLQEEFEDTTPQSNKTTFDEPLSFDESFSIPDSDTLGAKQPAPEQQGFVEPEQPLAQEPMNPNFSEMDSAKQRKKTKRFAKQIVALTCDLLEKGFEWYTMKDITESKLTEYEINDEMDLSLLLDMPNGQQASVKSFFLSQHEVIRQESKILTEDREDLTDALTEVFLEKGIAPTPMQELMLVGARIVGLQTLKAVAIVNSHKSILSQLRGMKQEETGYDDYVSPPTPQPQQGQKPPRQAEANSNTQTEVEAQQAPQPSSFEEIMFPIEQVKE
jgi:hypothetical protein